MLHIFPEEKMPCKLDNNNNNQSINIGEATDDLSSQC